MSKSNVKETDHETDSQIWLVVYRLPKKNHDAMVLNWKQVNELFRKHGGFHSQAFQLNNTKTYEDMGFTNIAKTISAKEDEEIWVELHSYRDRKHMDDVERGVMSAKTQNGENASQLFQQFTDLITPGSCIEGEFSLVGI